MQANEITLYELEERLNLQVGVEIAKLTPSAK